MKNSRRVIFTPGLHAYKNEFGSLLFKTHRYKILTSPFAEGRKKTKETPRLGRFHAFQAAFILEFIKVSGVGKKWYLQLERSLKHGNYKPWASVAGRKCTQHAFECVWCAVMDRVDVLSIMCSRSAACCAPGGLNRPLLTV